MPESGTPPFLESAKTLEERTEIGRRVRDVACEINGPMISRTRQFSEKLGLSVHEVFYDRNHEGSEDTYYLNSIGLKDPVQLWMIDGKYLIPWPQSVDSWHDVPKKVFEDASSRQGPKVDTVIPAVLTPKPGAPGVHVVEKGNEGKILSDEAVIVPSEDTSHPKKLEVRSAVETNEREELGNRFHEALKSIGNRLIGDPEKVGKELGLPIEIVYREQDLAARGEVTLYKSIEGLRAPAAYWVVNMQGNHYVFPSPSGVTQWRDLAPVISGDSNGPLKDRVVPGTLVPSGDTYTLLESGYIEDTIIQEGPVLEEGENEPDPLKFTFESWPENSDELSRLLDQIRGDYQELISKSPNSNRINGLIDRIQDQLVEEGDGRVSSGILEDLNFKLLPWLEEIERLHVIRNIEGAEAEDLDFEGGEGEKVDITEEIDQDMVPLVPDSEVAEESSPALHSDEPSDRLYVKTRFDVIQELGFTDQAFTDYIKSPSISDESLQDLLDELNRRSESSKWEEKQLTSDTPNGMMLRSEVYDHYASKVERVQLERRTKINNEQIRRWVEYYKDANHFDERRDRLSLLSVDSDSSFEDLGSQLKRMEVIKDKADKNPDLLTKEDIENLYATLAALRAEMELLEIGNKIRVLKGNEALQDARKSMVDYIEKNINTPFQLVDILVSVFSIETSYRSDIQEMEAQRAELRGLPGDLPDRDLELKSLQEDISYLREEIKLLYQSPKDTLDVIERFRHNKGI